MIRRRDLMLAGLGVGAFATAEALRPRKRLVLLRGTTIEKTIPARFGDWEAEATSELVNPAMAGRLARTLYSETVARIYHDSSSDGGIMLLAAYGDTQSDLLQLHRPESCYPAVGFTLEMAKSVALPLPGGRALPARRVLASTQERSESIVYWTRMGEVLPQTGEEQRMARLRNAVQGFVPDGILVRCSTTGDGDASFARVEKFIVAMLQAVRREQRPALIGSSLARALA